MAKVLDSWAMMAWIKDEEPAATQVQNLLDEARADRLDLMMSMMNVGEVYYLLVKRKGRVHAEQFWDEIQTEPLHIVEAPNDLILEAARWKSQYRISYADSFALATAVRRQAALVTGDPDFMPLRQAGVVELDWIGSS